jgi:hypothetical protein
MLRKNVTRTMVSILLAMLLGAALVVSCAQPASTPATPTAAPATKPAVSPSPAATTAKPKEPYGWTKAISIGAVSLKGTYYPCASGWAELAKKYYGITATPEVTGGSGANINLLETGQIEIGFVSPDVSYDAARGLGDYKGKKTALRAMLRGHGMMFHLLTLANSGIKKPEDMNGRSYMYNMKGSPANISFAEALREFYKLDKVKALTMTTTEDSIYAAGDGKADVGQTMSFGATALVETCMTKDIYFIPLSTEAQKFICNKLAWLEPMNIPKGTYKGLNNDVPSVGYNVTLYCMKDLPDDLVYMMTRVVLDHQDEFAKYHPRAVEWTLDNALKSPVTPFHNGAIRYFKEKGIWTPQMEELQKKLLQETGGA